MAESPTIEQLVAKIHAAPGQLVLAITGGGSGAINKLLSVPGGSRTLLEAIVPYSEESLVEFLWSVPEHLCSARTARCMAMAAFQRARHLRPEAAAPIGIGCTASLASDRPKRGPHRIHVALQTADRTATHSLELLKGRRTRREEEQLATQLILNTTAEAMGLVEQLALPLLESEQLESTRTAAPPNWQALLLGQTDLVSGNFGQTNAELDSVQPNTTRPAGMQRAGVIFPGAFNPLHEGHLRMAEISQERLGQLPEFEISIENVDKPPLDYTEMEHRQSQFAAKNLRLWFTRAPTFEEKSRLFPDATFIVGLDTLLRIGQPRYYRNDRHAMEAAIRHIADRGCRFLVFGRAVDGGFQSLDDPSLPDSLRTLCEQVPGSDFRADVSSTQLRKKGQN